MNKLEIELPIQVMVKVKVVELSKVVSKGLGIEWNTIGYNGNPRGLSFGSIINGAVITSLFNENDITQNLMQNFQKGVAGNWKYTKNGIMMNRCRNCK